MEKLIADKLPAGPVGLLLLCLLAAIVALGAVCAKLYGDVARGQQKLEEQGKTFLEMLAEIQSDANAVAKGWLSAMDALTHGIEGAGERLSRTEGEIKDLKIVLDHRLERLEDRDVAKKG